MNYKVGDKVLFTCLERNIEHDIGEILAIDDNSYIIGTNNRNAQKLTEGLKKHFNTKYKYGLGYMLDNENIIRKVSNKESIE